MPESRPELRFVCPCAEDDYKRHPDDPRRYLVPTSERCIAHNEHHPDRRPYRLRAADK